MLNNIHIDIMDYIYPASCTDEEFRKMWVEFEWENKVGNLVILSLWKAMSSTCVVVTSLIGLALM